MRDKCVVAEIGAPKGAVHNLVDVDRAHEFARRSQDDEAPVVGGRPQALDVRAIRLRRAGRWRPPSKEGPAAASSIQEARFIERAWSPELNPHLGLVALRQIGRAHV